jgi:hypothetical protein
MNAVQFMRDLVRPARVDGEVAVWLSLAATVAPVRALVLVEHPTFSSPLQDDVLNDPSPHLNGIGMLEVDGDV